MGSIRGSLLDRRRGFPPEMGAVSLLRLSRVVHLWWNLDGRWSIGVCQCYLPLKPILYLVESVHVPLASDHHHLGYPRYSHDCGTSPRTVKYPLGMRKRWSTLGLDNSSDARQWQLDARSDLCPGVD